MGIVIIRNGCQEPCLRHWLLICYT